jgi:hypothetical protein
MSNLSAFSFETINVNGVRSLTKDVYLNVNGNAEMAFITCEGACRWRYDGVVPTSTEGHLLTDRCFVILRGELQISNFNAINVGQCTLQVSYERK